MSIKSYLGKILAANPTNPRDSLAQSVILIISETDDLTAGIQINRPFVELTVSMISDQVGLWVDSNDSVYYGGNQGTSKIHVVHSLDWQGLSTQQISSDLAVTNDISVLSALSRHQGPTQFRACAGFWLWDRAVLQDQIENKNSPKYRWELVDGTIDAIFDLGSRSDHWNEIIERSAQIQINSWF